MQKLNERNRSLVLPALMVGVSLIYSICLMLTLSACTSNQPATPSTGDERANSGNEKDAEKQDAEKQDAEKQANELEDTDDELAVSHKSDNRKTNKAVSTQGEHTGVSTGGILVQQQNEYLGLTTIKLSKYGVRMDSPNITVVVATGKDAIAYNAQNGTSLPLTERTAAFLSGAVGDKHGGGVLKTFQMGKEKICGKDCIHYRLTKELKDKKTTETYNSWAEDVWATKDIKVPTGILRDCAKLTMLPSDMGFPVRIVRFIDSKSKEDKKDSKNMTWAEKVINGKKARDVIKTISFGTCEVDKGEFALLTGFKPVKDEMQLMMSGDDSELAGGTGLDELDKE